MKWRAPTIVATTILVACAGVTTVAGQAADLCSDNNNAYTVPAGTRYSDAESAWVCAPGAPGATAGGWVREVPPSTTTPTIASPPPAPSPAGPPAPAGHQAPQYLLWLALSAGCLACIAAVAAYTIRHVPRLHGHLVVADRQRTTRVDLSHRRAATIGTGGRVRVGGEGVLPQHAELRAEQNGQGAVDVVVRPKQGSVSLLRGKNVVHVAIATPLRDRDEIIIGAVKLQYRSLAAGVSRLAG